MIVKFLIIFLVFIISLVLGMEWGRRIYKRRVYKVLDELQYKFPLEFLYKIVNELEKEKNEIRN